VLTAHDVAGLRNGAVTLWQLAGDASRGARKIRSVRCACSIPAVRIDDAPAFGWRGLMLDSARHYQSPEFIERLIEWMALHKLNVLHWHLTDDQAWRTRDPPLPSASRHRRMAVPPVARPTRHRSCDGQAATHGGFYSQETVRHLVRYAAERNVTIVPEIEMPGHASAAIAAYPTSASTGGEAELRSVRLGYLFESLQRGRVHVCVPRELAA
jgi:hexosaminidase